MRLPALAEHRRPGTRVRVARHQLPGLMPAALITGPHVSISDFNNAPSASGVELSTTTPSKSNLARTSGSDSAVTVARLTLAMMSGGVLAGMNSAYHDDTSNPGTPDSAMVGSSGAVGNRRAVVTASPRSWPLRTVCSSEPVVLKMASTRPAMVSVTAPAPAPR